MGNRIEKLRNRLESAGTQAALLHSPENIRYFSGFTGEGCVFLSGDTRVVLTDSRYTEQAQRQAPGFDVREMPADQFTRAAAALAKESSASAVGYEDESLTVRQFHEFQATFGDIRLVPIGSAGVQIRAVKDAEEIALLREACRITDLAFQQALAIARPGISEIDLAVELRYYLAKTFQAPPSFEFIVAAGENGSMPHAIPSVRPLQAGDLVTLDFGADYRGYKADMTRTFAIGTSSDKMKEIYGIIETAQKMAAESLAPGKLCKAVDAVARDYIREHGYGACFGHGLGHGVGLQIHEQPVLNSKSETVLEPGMVVTVEPGIYLPGVGGVRIEDTCVITPDGWESLFAADKKLIIL